MTCSDCLATLRSADIDILRNDAEIEEHCRQCAECGRARASVLAATRRMADTLRGATPGVLPQIVAGVARIQAHVDATTYSFIQRLALLGTAAFAAGMIVVALHDIVPLLRRAALATAHVHAETLTLRCLSSGQAQGLARPYLRSFGSHTPAAVDRVPALTVVGTQAEIDQVRSMLARVDPAA